MMSDHLEANYDEIKKLLEQSAEYCKPSMVDNGWCYKNHAYFSGSIDCPFRRKSVHPDSSCKLYEIIRIFGSE